MALMFGAACSKKVLVHGRSEIAAVETLDLQGYGAIAGRVVDLKSGHPLPGANVWLENTTLGKATDDAGHFEIFRVPPGSYTLKVQFIGYVSRDVSNFTVGKDRKVTVNFYLAPDPNVVGCPVINPN